MSDTNENTIKTITAPDTIKGRQARLGDPLTMSVPDAGYKFLGLGRNSSYEAAKAGVIPTIAVGSKLRVPIAAMERRLEEVG
jgi:hypothetical protein